jgi:hypothetical protein
MDINTVTQGLNDICVETGVCPKNNGLPMEFQRENSGLAHEAKVIYAAELSQDSSKRVVRVACFDDKCVSSCVLEDGKTPAPCCHTAETGGMELTKAWIAHLKENGYRVKEIPVEE